VELLKKEGATHIINSEDEGFEETLKLQAEKLHATICYDAIGGVMTGRILKCMPKKSIIYVYGLLSGESINGVDVADLLYGHKVITGLFLPNWL
jgi:NADPH:quinone reductase-like Zn-dependent oxidoreductase